MELIQMTASYSNAVLMLVLSNATDIATKLELPINLPIQPAHVRRFVCDPRKNEIGGWLTLTNGYEFWFNRGHIDGMESAHSYFGLQDPDLIPRFFGTNRTTEAEAVLMARQAIRTLGYDPSWLKTAPKVEAAKTAPRDRPNVVPHYRIIWRGTEAGGFNRLAEVEVNGDARRIEKFWLTGPSFERAQPKIPQPPSTAAPPPSPTPTGGQRSTPVSDREQKKALEHICQKATEVAGRLKLPLKLPIRPKDVQDFEKGRLNGDLRGQIVLAKGWRFNYSQGYISGIYAPDSEFHIDFPKVPPIDVRRLLGKVSYTTEQVEKFARSEVRKLGYADEEIFLDAKPLVYGGPEERSPETTRFYVRWQPPSSKNWGDPDAQGTLVEVDGLKLELKAIWLRNVSLKKQMR